MAKGIVSRARWGGLPRGATKRTHPMRNARGVTLHWVGPGMGSFKHSDCARKVRGIRAQHRKVNGWADIAYNLLVCPHGYIFTGRGPGVRSAANGTTAANRSHYAVCYLGGGGDGFTRQGRGGMIAAVQLLREKGGAGDEVNGHRDHKGTDCPGDTIYGWLGRTDFGGEDWLSMASIDDVRKVVRQELRRERRRERTVTALGGKKKGVPDENVEVRTHNMVRELVRAHRDGELNGGPE